MATRPAGVSRLVSELAAKLYSHIVRGEFSCVEVMFTRYTRAAGPNIERVQVLPLDIASLAEKSRAKRRSTTSTRGGFSKSSRPNMCSRPLPRQPSSRSRARTPRASLPWIRRIVTFPGSSTNCMSRLARPGRRRSRPNCWISSRGPKRKRIAAGLARGMGSKVICYRKLGKHKGA